MGGLENLSGQWNSWYQYESGGVTLESTHVLDVCHEKAGGILATSINDSPKESRLVLNLTVTGLALQGNWEERTDTRGPYQGHTFTGLLELTLNEAGTEARGTWTGVSRSGASKSGAWVLSRLTEEL